MKIFFMAFLIIFSYATSAYATSAMEIISTNMNRMAKQRTQEIIRQSGKVKILVPAGFLETFPKHPPMERFSLLVQRSVDVREALVGYTKKQFPQYRDLRPNYEKVHSSLKRNELMKEILLRPDKFDPLVISPLETRRVMEKYRIVATNELDMTTTKHSVPILCTSAVGVSVAVIVANLKKQTALMAHVMETSILDRSFKKCVEELLSDYDHADDLRFSMLTTDMAPDFRVIEGVQNKIVSFFEKEMMLNVKVEKYVLQSKREHLVNICYDPRDNAIFLSSGYSRIPCDTTEEAMEYLFQEKRVSMAWFLTDFSDRRNWMKLDINTRINLYFSELQAPFVFFGGMNSLGVECAENSEFPFSLVKKEEVLECFFKDIL